MLTSLRMEAPGAAGKGDEAGDKRGLEMRRVSSPGVFFIFVITKLY